MIHEQTLSAWILNTLKNPASTEPLNVEAATGIFAYIEDNKYHFVYQRELREISHISAQDNILRDNFHYTGVGILELRDNPQKEPTFNQTELHELCKNILNLLSNRQGSFKMIRNGSSYEFILLQK